MKTTFKQLAGLAIDLKHRAERNTHLITHIRIIAAVTLYLAIVIGGSLYLMGLMREAQVAGTEEAILLASTGGGDYAGFIEGLGKESASRFYQALVFFALITVLFGFLMARIALRPLKQAFEMQKSFISGIAHEIRTPLSILRMNNEIAQFDLDPSSPMQGLIDENLSDVDKINEILNNLLLFDRMGSKELLRIVEKVDLLDTAKEVANQFRALANQKKISIFITGNGIPPVMGNRTAIEQVFFNLLKNAMLYSQSGGRITITAPAVTDKHVTIRVTDTGVGIPSKDLSRIFEPFYRSDKTGKLSGTGIGLAIVLEIMKMHKGSIEVESIEGVGTSFLLIFPIRPSKPVRRFFMNPVSKIFFDFSKRK